MEQHKKEEPHECESCDSSREARGSPLGGDGHLFDRLGLGVDDDVRHAAGEHRPHLAGHQVGSDAGSDAELEELFHRAMEARPLVPVLVVAGIQEAPAPVTARGFFLELRGQFGEHGDDVVALLGDAAGMEADVRRDPGGRQIGFLRLVVLEQAVHEGLLDPLGVENVAHFRYLSVVGEQVERNVRRNNTL